MSLALNEHPHHPDCPATDGFGCHCNELNFWADEPEPPYEPPPPSPRDSERAQRAWEAWRMGGP